MCFGNPVSTHCRIIFVVHNGLLLNKNCLVHLLKRCPEVCGRAWKLAHFVALHWSRLSGLSAHQGAAFHRVVFPNQFFSHSDLLRWHWCDGRRVSDSPWSVGTLLPCSWRLPVARSWPTASCRCSPSPPRASGWASLSEYVVSPSCAHTPVLPAMVLQTSSINTKLPPRKVLRSNIYSNTMCFIVCLKKKKTTHFMYWEAGMAPIDKVILLQPLKQNKMRAVVIF